MGYNETGVKERILAGRELDPGTLLAESKNGDAISMKILFFGTKSYDKQFFNETWKDKVYEQIEIDYVDVLLTPDTARLAQGYEAVCAFCQYGSEHTG